MRDTVKIAAVQMEPKIMQNRQNLDYIKLKIKTAAESGANLIVFPECALSGYIFTSLEEAIPYMETIPGPCTEELATLAREFDVYIITGMLEKDNENHFNAAVFIGPEGFIGKYRKVHLPFLGIDRFLDKGEMQFSVYNTAIGNIGMHICYDCSFPEPARVMSLMGADILVLPTNWAEARQIIPNHVVFCRAYENKVNFVAANRVGVERNVKFIGLSRIIDTYGNIISKAVDDEEQIVYGDVSLSEARQKHVIIKKGECENNLIADRRPKFYQKITDISSKL